MSIREDCAEILYNAADAHLDGICELPWCPGPARQQGADTLLWVEGWTGQFERDEELADLRRALTKADRDLYDLREHAAALEQELGWATKSAENNRRIIKAYGDLLDTFTGQVSAIRAGAK